jgi:transposase InsO family protein
MPYTKNPFMPGLRAKAVLMLRTGKTVRETARYFGVAPGTISKWSKKMPSQVGVPTIPTLASRPKSHPKKLSLEIVQKIINKRTELNGRCAEVVHAELLKDGVKISVSSVKRTLVRNMLLKKRSPWKHKHDPIERPKAAKPGDLVQIDTIHLKENGRRIYIYTLIDVYSRYAFAAATERINTHASIKFVSKAKQILPFEFKMLQSDHGSEFSQNFTERIKISHRHSRVRTPNDNAHLERFNRTLQDECLNKVPKELAKVKKELNKYLKYYNNGRLHLGISLRTPAQLAT